MNGNRTSGLRIEDLLSQTNLTTGSIVGAVTAIRRLSDLRGCFEDEAAYARRLAAGDDVAYQVATVERPPVDGALSYGLGTLYPGRVGHEYFLTKGHHHARREAAEVYIALRGEGGVLMEAEDGVSRFVPMRAGSIVYVPGRTAHRTVNTCDSAFTYLGVYPADAGHDYVSIEANNFRMVVVAGADGPETVQRREYRAQLVNQARLEDDT
ncbi:MAG: glucose-6-phosphate isomerase [Bifidobacteriaceae bacterium]|nr:glucose-6-phosphate isomerase [Bifidobacteriaceae bacterium]